MSNKPKLDNVSSIEEFINKGVDAEAALPTQGPVTAPEDANPQPLYTADSVELCKFNMELPYALRLHIKLLAAQQRRPMNELLVEAVEYYFMVLGGKPVARAPESAQ